MKTYRELADAVATQHLCHSCVHNHVCRLFHYLDDSGADEWFIIISQCTEFSKEPRE